MGVGRSLLKLAIGTSCAFTGLACAPMFLEAGSAVGAILASFIGNVAISNTANALDVLTDGQDPDQVSLENQHLTKAVGKAIAAVITLAARKQQGKTRQYLERIATQAKDNWVTLAQQELIKESYPQLREAKLDQVLTPDEYQLTQEGNLTVTEWGDIFIRLNMAAQGRGGFPVGAEVREQVADLLHTTFPKAFRETLKEDFAQDGKAFAGLTLQLLTGMKAELATLRQTSSGAELKQWDSILQSFQQLESQLRGTIEQQQAAFQQMAEQIDSGFVEVCRQMGAMETTITGLLHNLEARIADLRDDVAVVREEMNQGFEQIRAQRGGRELSRQEYRIRQALLEQTGTEVKERLSQSLHYVIFGEQSPLILGKEQQPYQVQRPWDVSVKMGEQRSRKLPPNTSILEIFQSESVGGRLLILGKPGSGKTTTLLELAQALVAQAEQDGDAPIPVILELSSWQKVTKGFLWKKKEYDPSIQEWVLTQLERRGVSAKVAEKWLESKEFVLLLDGLDELPSEQQEKCVQALNKFIASEYCPFHLVVCSRKEEYETHAEMLHLNSSICLEDLSTEQIEHYFNRINLGELWDSLQRSEKIVDLIRQPLFLGITSIAYQQIDVEEWRNCNTEERAINYLLGIYRLKSLGNKYRKYYKNELDSVKNQYWLVNLAKYTNKKKVEEFDIVSLVQYQLLRGRLQKYLCVFFSLLAFSLTYSIIIFFAPEKNHYTMIDDWIVLVFLVMLILFIKSAKFMLLFCLVFFTAISLAYSREYKSLSEYKSNFAPTFFYSILLGAIFLLERLLESYRHALDGSNDPFNAVLISSLAFSIMSLLTKDSIYFIRATKVSINSALINSFVAIAVMVVGYIPFMFVGGSVNYVWMLLTSVGFAVIVGILTIILSSENSCEIADKLSSKEVILHQLMALIVFFMFGLLTGSISGLAIADVEVVLGNGLILGAAFSMFPIFSCIQYTSLRFTLSLMGQIPWNITQFLDHCTERLVLQRVGYRYRFIHRLVQEHFANLDIQKE